MKKAGKKNEKPRDAIAHHEKVFDWKVSEDLQAYEEGGSGRILYSGVYLSKVLTDTPYAFWGGVEEFGQQGGEVMAYFRTQLQPTPPDNCKLYLAAVPIDKNLDTDQEITNLVSAKIEALTLTVDLTGESLLVCLVDRVRKEKQQLMHFLPRLLWETILDKYLRVQFVDIVRVPFYANLYEELDSLHPLIPRTDVLDRIRKEAVAAKAGRLGGLPIDILRQIMCRLTPHQLACFSRVCKFAYRVASDDDVWCWQCATRLHLNVLPTLMKAICTEYRRLWILLNNHVCISFQKANVRTKYGQPYSHFVVDLHVGPLRHIVRSPFPNRQFAPERAKE